MLNAIAVPSRRSPSPEGVRPSYGVRVVTEPGPAPVYDERVRVERAVSHLLSSVPTGWAQLHLEIGSAGLASAYVRLAGAGLRPLAVSAAAVEDLRTYLHTQSVGAATPQRLVVDCFPDGRLSAQLQPDPVRVRRWPRRFLVAVTTVCLVAAAVVFAVAWRWAPTPEADADLLPAPTPREQEAFVLISDWFDALARNDEARVQALVCATPSGFAQNDIEVMRGGVPGGVDYAEAVVQFNDSGTKAVAKVVLRTRPLTEAGQQQVDDYQRESYGLAYREYVLTDDGSGLKVCGGE